MKKKLSVLLIALLTIGQAFAEDEIATIILSRPQDFGGMLTTAYGGKNYYALDHFIYLDNQYLGNVTSGTYFEIEVETGSHTIVGYVGNKGQERAKEEGQKYSLTINTIANQTYYASINEKKMTISKTDEKKWKKETTTGIVPVGWGATIAFKGGVVNYLKTNPMTSIKNADMLTQNNERTQQVTAPQSPSSASKPKRVLSDVDQNIPTSKNSADDTYVLIIANEEYQFLDNVNFASYDGETFKEYCIKTLGVPERQIRYCPNATYGILSGGVDWLSYALNNFEGSRAIVYYCGHGIPDEKTNEAYIIPVDGKGTNTATCYSLNRLYKTLADTKAASITYFMDACFTGANKEGSMLVAARGVAREAKKETIEGKAVVFSASSGDETAMTYEEKQHGLFTYYLLKKLQETEGNVTYEDLASYISKNVKKDAFLLNEKPQTPVVATSPAAAETWKSMKLK